MSSFNKKKINYKSDKDMLVQQSINDPNILYIPMGIKGIYIVTEL